MTLENCKRLLAHYKAKGMLKEAEEMEERLACPRRKAKVLAKYGEEAKPKPKPKEDGKKPKG